LNGLAGSGGIFRNRLAYHLGSFAVNVENGSALKAELVEEMLAIELASNMNWKKLWLETDSKLVVAAFSNFKVVPWQSRQRWNHSL